MSSVWYGLSIVGVAIVIFWFIQNDALTDGQTKGIFAMKPPGGRAARKRRRKRAKFSLKDVS
jgi:hypothetical protein